MVWSVCELIINMTMTQFVCLNKSTLDKVIHHAIKRCGVDGREVVIKPIDSDRFFLLTEI